MAKAKHAKTNAIRLLEQQKIHFDVIEYETGDGQVDGVSVAEKIGHPVTRVFKTLVAKASAQKLFVFIIPVAEELDLKAAAKVVGEKKIEMLAVKDLLGYTGYVRGGCSPVGMKKLYPTVIDESALGQDSIIVSAGKIGMQIHVQLDDLKNMTKAQLAPITTTHA
ncbi:MULTISPECIES: Cys-tRNA(Pro) deacylase [Lysinibacillus]|jgi:Cys-tRNA(Pro)/Cys-tRNA(Cys) deacylase|uniref:Cys-tRNA(Pro)/Cys-tRNA(Cys) deacylase n=1 Tax=Lysinibacillus fusiformis TaxID=28031 RepID=A0A2I0V665_9BACI|nr:MULTISPECIES: Cys-tRNA(Pro) deacylase [Lysinibacillus]KUF35949.1 cysteinyl-tRNA(Pro) deacylase [Lysinibacillus sp. F5]PKU53809.1 Cys-tRNA(Pro) deacylase [Lysinibacillus fusiformis]WCH48242.1 Cys-tRNA(Pro) deacylase [Lysinibacillus sp. OF-1]SCY51411.1 Cys-tRNA(Pro)/Cys-tRNA(Cys) deacylase [Lysinibacillus sp. SG9]SDB22488.1 Cys-tRNA(Pro)/Cys-tRNA(Cys) deacylase [Lysinibacillus sp. TC-37]